MNRIRPFFATVCVFLVLSFGTLLHGAEFKPILSVSVGSTNHLLVVSKEISRLFGQWEELAPYHDALSRLDGLHRSEPITATILHDGKEFFPLLILPFNDFEKARPFVAAQSGFPIIVKDREKKIYTAFTPIGAVTLVQHKDCVLGTIELCEEHLPADPAPFIPRLDPTTALAFRFHPENTTFETMQELLAPVQLALMMTSFDPNALKAIEQLNTSLEHVFSEYKSLAVDLHIDLKTGAMDLVQTEHLRAGGRLAQEYAAVKKMHNPYLGFFQPEKAVAALSVVDTIPETVRFSLQHGLATFCDGIKAQLEENDDVNAQLFLPLLAKLRETATATIHQGSCLFAGTIKENGTILAAGAVADGQRLRESLDGMIESAKKSDKTYREMLNRSMKRSDTEESGFQWTSFSIPFDAVSEKLPILPAAFKGKSLVFIYGITENTVCFAAGLDDRDVLQKELSQAIAAMKNPGPDPDPSAVFSLAPLGRLLKEYGIGQSDASMESLIETLIKTEEPGITLSESFENERHRFKLHLDGSLYPAFVKIYKQWQDVQTAHETTPPAVTTEMVE